MEIEKPVLQQTSTSILKCYRELNFNSPLSRHQHQSSNKTETMMKIDNMVDDDNGNVVNRDNGNSNDNMSNRKSGRRTNHLLLEEAKDEEADNNNNDDDNDNDNIKLSNTTFKQHFTDFDDIKKEQTTTTTTVTDLNCSEFPSFQYRFSTDEIPELDEKNSQDSQTKSNHLVSSFCSSASIPHQYRRSDRRIVDEKRPRIERPRARYPNSSRRTSAPACLWSTPLLLSHQQPKSISSLLSSSSSTSSSSSSSSSLSLHDNLVLLHKLLAKQRIIQENVTAFNVDPSASISNVNDDIAAASQLETSSATIAPHFPSSQTTESLSALATWQWLRG